MNTSLGYSKKTLTNSNVLLSGGGDKALSEFIGSLNWDSTNKKLQYKSASSTNFTDLITFGARAFDSTSYLPLSGGTMTGLLTTTSGSHKGIKIGDTYITAIGGELILQNNDCIRFGADDWSYDKWAGLRFDSNNNTIYLGVADGTIFHISPSGVTGVIKTPNITDIYVGNGTYKVWHENNDGSGSGLDADLLDGKHYSDVILSNGRNLVRNYNTESTSSSYQVWSMHVLTETVSQGDKITITIEYSLASGATKTWLLVYTGGGYASIASFDATSGLSHHVQSVTTTMSYASGHNDNGVCIFYGPGNKVGTCTIHRVKVERGDHFTGWTPAPEDIITSNIIGLQSVNYANSAGSVAWANVTSKPSAIGSTTLPIYWNGSTFVLANSYPTKASWNYDDVYVKSVSISGNSLRINKNGSNDDLTIPYATSAGSVAWSNITGVPINFKAYLGSLASSGWKTLQGRGSSPSIAIAYNNGAASWNSSTYSASLVFGCSDTRGLLDCDHNIPKVTFGGGSYSNSTDDNPKWYMKLSGTNETTYNLDSMPYATSAGDADTLDGYHYNQTSRGFINIDYNRNGPYWMLIASRDYSTDKWAWAKMVFTIASSAYAERTVTYGIVEVAYNHQNATAASAPKISAKWLLKSLSTQDDSVRVEINTSTKYINVYLQNNLWDSNIECHIIHADGFNYLGHGLTAGSWVTAPALSTNVINPSNAVYYGDLSGNADSATKLKTERTLWGQSFDGSGNISGNMTSVGDIISSSSYSLRNSSTNPYLNLQVGSQNWFVQSLSDGIYVGSAAVKSLKVDINGNLTISHTTNATMTATSTNPKITFADGDGTQPVHLTYTDYDSYRSPAGLKVVGGTSASPAWFEAEGNMYSSGFIKNSSSDSYVLLGGGGHKALTNLQVTGTASALNALDVTKTFIYATVSSNQTLGVSAAMTVGQVLTVLVYNSGSSSITVTVPTSDSWKSLDGLSLTIGALKFGEISILCYTATVYMISAKLQ